MRYTKRIRTGGQRQHVERVFNERKRPTVRRLRLTQVEQVEAALKAGHIESTEYVPVVVESVSSGQKESRVPAVVRTVVEKVAQVWR